MKLRRRFWRWVWNTEWIPDQTEPLQIAARIVDDTGLTYLTPAVTCLRLKRPEFSVELCKPINVPSNWVTRRKEYQESVEVKGILTRMKYSAKQN